MSGLQFEEEQNMVQPHFAVDQSQDSSLTSKFAHIAMQLGIINNETQVSYVMIGFAAILLIAAFFIPKFIARAPSQLPSPELVNAAFEYSPVNQYRK